MKIIHTSDLHLCSALTSRLDPRRAAIRRRELISTFERLVGEAEKNGVRAIIIAGDLFDTERITDSAASRVYDTIVSHRDITFIYLVGNHEGAAFISRISEKLPENLKVFASEDFTSYTVDDVTFHGSCRTEGRVFDSLRCNDATSNVAVLHGDLKKTGDGISLEALSGTGLDYLALGHYHTYSYKTAESGAVAVYSGTPEGRGFDECGSLGYVLIDTDKKPIAHTFVPFSKRRLYDIPVDITGKNSQLQIEEAISRAVAHVTESDLLRVRLIGEYELDSRPDIARIEDKFVNNYWHFELKNETRLAISIESFRYDKTLKGEFIRLVLLDESLSDDMREKVIECGIRALMLEVDTGDFAL